jgi:hypothetical protein
MDTDGHPELINRRFAYASVSRASHDAQLFTNDAATLAERLSRDVSKTSAMDLTKGQSPVVDGGLERVQVVLKIATSSLGLTL